MVVVVVVYIHVCVCVRACVCMCVCVCGGRLNSYRLDVCSLVGWDDRSFYFDHKMVAESGFLHAYGVSKHTLRRGSELSVQQVVTMMDPSLARAW